MRAADYSKRAAEGEYPPSLSLSADYGLATTLSTYASHGVFDVRGTLSIPIFLGGKVHGDVLQADARLAQSRQRLDSLRAQIDTDVRTALLNLQSAEEQVVVARSTWTSPTKRSIRLATALPRVSPTRWKWCRRKKRWPARTSNTSPACTPITTPRFLWHTRVIFNCE